MTRYMISYIDANPPAMNNGNVEVTLPGPLTSMDQISRLQQDLRRQLGLNNPIIMGFSLFDDGEGFR